MNSEKTFLILGASSDLGIGVIKTLNKEYENSLFALHYHSDDAALKDIEWTNGNSALYFKADFSTYEGIFSLIEALKEKDVSPTHILHLPSAKLIYTRLKDFDHERIEANARIQVYSFVEILKAFLPQMIKRKENDKVVAVLSSTILSTPDKSMLEYGMTKTMLLSVIKQLATDNAGKKININAVSPSMIETKFLSDIDSRIVEMAADGSSEKRNATVDDIVPSICFLLSDKSNYINGVNLNVSNGNVIC